MATETPNTETPTTRVVLHMSPDRMEEMNYLIDVCGLTGHRELFNEALTTFGWIIKAIQEGRVVASVDDANKRYTTLSSPALKAAAAFAAAAAAAAAAKTH